MIDRRNIVNGMFCGLVLLATLVLTAPAHAGSGGKDEACCLPDGTCIVTQPSDCVSQGGMVMDGGSCSVVTCVGACCLPNGSCEDGASPDSCAQAGGTYEGNVQCDSQLCAQACCLPDGSCVMLPPIDCAEAGGGTQFEQSCLDAICAGACCYPDGTCENGTDAETCESDGGVYQGYSTSCTALECPVACCLADGTCVNVIPLECISLGGTGQAGTDCAGASCGGACCFPDGSCTDDVSAGECEGGGGTYQGLDSDCKSAVCPQACCLQDGSCITVPDFDCTALGGIPQDVSCGQADCPIEEQPGWNWLDNQLTLTADQPVYWSAMTGQPAGGGLSPFTALDPGFPPGRPANDGTGERVLRGFIVGWAVNADGEEIRWNHLLGNGTIINYKLGSAWEYNAYTVPVVDPAVGNGEQSGTPGVLNLDGMEYALGFDHLMVNFAASGSTSFSGPSQIITDTDLTLHPLDVDVRQATDGPVTTKASFTVWNQNEVKFSGAHRCVTCWDQTLLSQYDIPNHFLIQHLQTAHGTARIEGHAAPQCDQFDDPSTPEDESVTSVEASLLGLAARFMMVDGGGVSGPGDNASSGGNLVGLGGEVATIRFDPLGGGSEGQIPSTPRDILDWLERQAGIDRTGNAAPTRLSTDLVPTSGIIGERRPSGTEKGSLIYFSKVELRWEGTAPYAPIQDTFLSLTNDTIDEVDVLMYFINGDPPVGP